MAPEKKKEGIFASLEKFSVPAILVLTFAIGGSYAVTQQTLASHTGRLTNVEVENKSIKEKVNEMEKVPVKYDEQITFLSKQQEQTNQNIRDLRISVEKTNELMIQILDDNNKKRK